MSTSYKDAKELEFKYWKTKPVLGLKEKNYISSNILQEYEIDKKYLKDKQTSLPIGYSWVKVELTDNMKNVADFLTLYYLKESNKKYIIKYDPEYIKWQFRNQGYFLVITNLQNEYIAVIGLTPRTVEIYANSIQMMEPMFMCCHPKYRKKGLAKVLMNEATRMASIDGYKYGIFCDNIIVPSPVARIRYYSRPLNYIHLKQNEFVEVSGINDEQVHDKTKIKLRPNKNYVVAKKTIDNIETVHKMYSEYVDSFSLHLTLTLKDVENYMFDSRYVKTIFVLDESEKPIDFITYNFYDIHNGDQDV
ncbi:MAG: glycylpeptide N-tetradecanoyltransferase 1, partial [Dasosvirus sp.]